MVVPSICSSISMLIKIHGLISCVIIVAFIGMSSCKSDTKNQINTIELTAEKTITEINDSTFLASHIDGIKYFDNCIFFSDFKNNRVLCTDTEFNLLKTFGQAGKGPGDLINPLGCLVHDGELLVYNAGGKRINRYNTNTCKYIGSIPFKNHLTSYKYISLNEVLIVSYGWEQYPIAMIDLKGNTERAMGSKDHILELNAGMQRNFQFTNVDNKKHFLAICESEPIIEKYSITGEMIGRFNLSEHPLFRDKIKRFSETRKDPGFHNATFSFITDTYFDKGKLYILTPSFNDDEQKICKMILVFEVTSDEIIPFQNILLNPHNDSWYSSFTVFSDKIIAYDVINYEIHQFEIPKFEKTR